MISLCPTSMDFDVRLGDPSVEGLRVRRNVADGASHVALVGELDIGTVEGLQALLGDEPLRRLCELDCSGLSFIDCAGMRLLCALADQVNSNGSTFRINPTCQPLTRLLSLADPTNELLRHALSRPAPRAARQAFAPQPLTQVQLRPNADGAHGPC